jgi:hypothetical protein
LWELGLLIDTVNVREHLLDLLLLTLVGGDLLHPKRMPHPVDLHQKSSIPKAYSQFEVGYTYELKLVSEVKSERQLISCLNNMVYSAMSPKTVVKLHA